MECGCCKRVVAVEGQRAPDWKTIDLRKVLARREPFPMRWKIITRGVGRLDGPDSVASSSRGDTVGINGEGVGDGCGRRAV